MLNSWPVSRRITSGFLVLLALMVALSAYSFFSMRMLGGGYEDYRAKTQQTTQIDALIENVLQMRVDEAEYHLTGSGETAEKVEARIDRIATRSQTLRGMGISEERMAEIQAVNTMGQEYLAGFEKLHRLTDAEHALEARMETTGEAMAEDLATLAALAVEDGNIQVVRMAGTAEEKFILTRLHVTQYFLSSDDGHIETARLDLAEVAEAMARLERAVTPANMRTIIERTIANLASYTDDLDRADINLSAAKDIRIGTLDRIAPQMQARFQAVAQDIKAQQAALGESGEAIVTRSTWLTLAASLLAVFATIGVALFVSRWIGDPLRALVETTGKLTAGDTSAPIDGTEHDHEFGRLAQALSTLRDTQIERRDVIEPQAERERGERERVVAALGVGLRDLSSGKLTARLHERFAPEYEQLRTDFNEAMEKLQDAMHSVVMNAGNINNAAGEISQSSDDLARRTENQAATLEETAAAMEELTASVSSTADGAGKANRFVTDTKKSAEASGAVVRETVEAMSRIQQSSDQISQIIGVIDDIAFQTNLLALNAGVEAARAGEAGRGFAVVASEVRALAQRSSDAAKEIKELISDSSQHVESGVDLVNRTGTALGEIVTMVGTVSDLVAEISAATSEQSTGLVEINTSVNQLDQVTQQNAAMVQEATAASHELTRDANALTQLTARFSMDGAGRAPSPAPVAANDRTAPSPVARPERGTAPATRGALALQPEPVADDDWSDF